MRGTTDFELVPNMLRLSRSHNERDRSAQALPGFGLSTDLQHVPDVSSASHSYPNQTASPKGVACGSACLAITGRLDRSGRAATAVCRERYLQLPRTLWQCNICYNSRHACRLKIK